MLTADRMLAAYAQGVFPMAEHRDSAVVHWVDPQLRGIVPLQKFHISRSLSRRMRQENYTIRTDTAFVAVVKACADRRETWISQGLLRLYRQIYERGFAHSLEVWEEGMLVGGVFGLTLGRAFFGESMFSRRTDASKIALAYLVDRLRLGGFTLFDTQFLTPHLASLGGVEITRDAYRRRLSEALEGTADWAAPGPPPPAQDVLQRNSQTSNRG